VSPLQYEQLAVLSASRRVSDMLDEMLYY